MSWLVVACGGSKPEPKLDDLPQQKMELSAAKSDNAPSGSTIAGSLQPILVSPTVQEGDVAEQLDTFTAPDSASLIAQIDRRIAPARAHDGFMDDLKRTLTADTTSFSAAPFDDVSMGAYVLRTGGKNAGLVVRKHGDFIVPPLSWMRAVIWFKDLDAAASREFYVQMSERLGTAGHASAIAIFTNGNALGIVMEERRGDDNDIAIVAQTQFMKVGSFDASAWGPSVKTSQGVSSKDGNGHKGLNARDFLKKIIAPAAPTSASPGGSLSL